ncbi:MAG TPA: 16S rRNA (cytosine(967)-C(5))-methyltransferase RsmB [Bacillota bacterium]|nr:16S rRNA (cytosine(967)-C(5))-methyltransferase RsmB [Bacillota bacterium]HPZ89860.1 16S rRNA (cytosine(967)-C(5))-methyltransferase RsmB [Bacillota bacterium]HQE01124.1 16S rRNA (cytosine(967)-C(5))-methyltransferase RsmB [Bacillota bacterium]
MKSDISAAREVALAVLLNIEKNKAYSGLSLAAEIPRHSLKEQDERLVRRLVYGVVSQRLRLDYVLNQFCRREVGTLSPSLRNILRLGCYQLLDMDRIPQFAAVSEAVAQARRVAGQRMAGFVNGVLRNIIRNRDHLFQDLKPGTVEAVSIAQSHPRWLVEEWTGQWGLDFTAALCAANNELKPLAIRVNTCKIGVDEYLAAAAAQGLTGARSRFAPQGVVFPADTPFARLPGYAEGWFIVQGEASMLPALCLGVEPGQAVLDMCSAPGGKATQLAAMNPRGYVTACDISAARLNLVRQNAARLGLNNLEYVEADAARLDRVLARRFSRILVDAPCSGLGVIAQKPEIKWLRKPADIGRLAELQLQILHAGCNLLEPRGILVYSTCTLLEDENQQVIRTLLAQRRDVVVVDPGMPELTNEEGFIQTFPHIHGLDGFFIAKLMKVE